MDLRPVTRCGGPAGSAGALPDRHRFAICDACHREMQGFSEWD